jgi:thioesterase domain-containing protein
LLGGFCNGALIAFEMARRLERLGEKVSLLALIYASAASARSRRLNKFKYYARRASELAHAGLDEQREFINRKAREITARLFGAGLGVKARGWGLGVESALSRNRDLFKSNGENNHPRPRRSDITAEYNKLMDSYLPRAYAGRVTLFWPEEALHEIQGDSTAGWGRIARRGVDVQVIPGKHLTCITRHVESLAERLKACLDAQ